MDKIVALKNRFYLVIILILFGIVAIVIGSLIKSDVFKNILITVGTAMLSAAVTIYLVKYDIMQIIQKNCMEDQGITYITKGRDSLFLDEISKKELKADNWKKYLSKAKNKEIDIVGVAMYSFFCPNDLIKDIGSLSKKGYKINIIFADPNSKEVEIQASEEKKPGSLKSHIEIIVNQICDLYKEDEQKKDLIKENLKMYYSKSLPKAFIVRAGTQMIVTPYLLNGPFKMPTFIVNECGDEKMYNCYKDYIDQIIKSGTPVDIN